MLFGCFEEQTKAGEGMKPEAMPVEEIKQDMDVDGDLEDNGGGGWVTKVFWEFVPWHGKYAVKIAYCPDEVYGHQHHSCTEDMPLTWRATLNKERKEALREKKASKKKKAQSKLSKIFHPKTDGYATMRDKHLNICRCVQ